MFHRKYYYKSAITGINIPSSFLLPEKNHPQLLYLSSMGKELGYSSIMMWQSTANRTANKRSLVIIVIDT